MSQTIKGTGHTHGKAEGRVCTRGRHGATLAGGTGASQGEDGGKWQGKGEQEALQQQRPRRSTTEKDEDIATVLVSVGVRWRTPVLGLSPPFTHTLIQAS